VHSAAGLQLHGQRPPAEARWAACSVQPAQRERSLERKAHTLIWPQDRLLGPQHQLALRALLQHPAQVSTVQLQ